MSVTISGADEAQARMLAIAERLKNLQPVLEVVAQDTKTLIDDSFHRSVSPSGSPWAKLSPATESINPRRKNGKPLIDTARLRNSITSRADASAVLFGTNTKYAGPHQFGARVRVFGKGPTKRLTARPFLPIQKSGSRFRLMTAGNAGLHWTAARAMVATYIRTGTIE